jgi:hypothetical protein
MTQQKIAVFPIPCQLVGAAGALNSNIIRLSMHSILVNTGPQPLLVNSAFHVKFFLPVVKQNIETETVVFKTYDEFKGKHGEVQPGHHVAELVLKNKVDPCTKYFASLLAHLQLNSMM